MRWLTTETLLILSAAFIVDAADEHNKGTAAATPIRQDRREKSLAHDLSPDPKNLGVINDKFESVATKTHSAVSKMAREAPSNDDPGFILFQTTVTLNGTTLTQSPTMEPSSSNSTGSPSTTALVASMMSDTQAPSAERDVVASPTSFPTHLTTSFVPTSKEQMSVTPTQSGGNKSSSSSPSSSVDEDEDNEDNYDSTGEGAHGDAITGVPSTSTTRDPTHSPYADVSSQVPTRSNALDPTYSPSASVSTLLVPTSSNTLDTTIETAPTENPTTSNDEHETSDADEETLVPTYSPTESSTSNSTSSSVNTNIQPQDGKDECPQEFDTSLKYNAGDMVSTIRNPRCGQGKRCAHIAYQCKQWPESVYCDLIVPGRRNSDKGWLKLGRCILTGNQISLNNSTAPVKDQGEFPFATPTLSPTVGVEDEDESAELLAKNDTAMPSTNTPTSSSISTTDQPPPSSTTASSSQAPGSSHHHQDSENVSNQSSLSPTSPFSSTTTVPTPSPITRRFGYSPMWSKPIDGQDDSSNVVVDANSSILVNLPRIICDITLPSSLQNFERKHVLLAAMTTIIYDLFNTHLPASLYDLAGISLNIEVKGNDNNDIARPSTVRLHAYFTGTSSFSLRGAPTQNDLITLLIRYFDVDEFNRRLRTPQQARMAKSQAEESIKVNSVFFTLEDGSLVLVGSSYAESKLPTTVTPIGQDRSRRMQIASVLSALITMACVLGLVSFLLYSNRKNNIDEEDNNHGTESALEEGQSRIAQQGESSESAASKVEVEIIVSTLQMSMSDVSDKSMVSSLSESPFTARGRTSSCNYELDSDPLTPGLGISKTKRYQYVGNSSLGFDAENWQPRNWEMYKNSTVQSPS